MHTEVLARWLCGRSLPDSASDERIVLRGCPVTLAAHAGGTDGVLDSAELRASYDLVDDAALQASADAKMNELGAREAEGYVQAMQLEM